MNHRLLSAAALLLSCTAAYAEPVVLAHRGGPAQLPENTLPAFRQSLSLGVDILEFDMNLTSDDRVALHHDTSVNSVICLADPKAGLTHGPIRMMTLQEAQSFDCGSRHPPNFPAQQAVPGTRMPSLEEFLEATRDSKALFFGETKMPKPDAGYSVDPELFARKVNAIVSKYGVEDRFILQSFDYRVIDAMYQLNPRIRTCLLGMQRHKPNYLEAVRRHHASCVVLRRDYADASDFKQLKDAGVTVYSDVVDRAEEWQAYAALGVDAIFTNDPVGLIEYLKKSGLRD
ncbi:MAG TPA: glycerophosphodiester phosphodiesterase family protein [Steroidobacter sp.]|nr:glycerophosphodiester phosphodiesterase family protein [Steroidobacter sp.]